MSNGTTDFATFKAVLADWANRGDWSDALLTSFVRDAEQRLNSELRVDRMIKTVISAVMQDSAPLPDDWLESDLMLIANPALPSGWQPIRYKPRDEFFNLPPPSSSNNSWYDSLKYTIEGRTIFFGGPVNAAEGTQFQFNYYGEVPVFSDTLDSWVYDRYPSLYRYAALMHADLHAVGEEQQSQMLGQMVTDMIQKLNAAHRYSRASGSLLSRSRRRSFG